MIHIPVAHAATTDSVTTLTAATIVRRVTVVVTTVYPPGVDLTVGNATTPNLLMIAGVANMQQLGTYSTGDIAVAFAGGTAAVRANLSNAPGSGACDVYVDYVVTPNT